MTTYYIYDISNDNFLGTVQASNISEAESKANRIESIFSKVDRSEYITAFTEQI